VNRDGQWLRHGQSHRQFSSEVRIIGKERFQAGCHGGGGGDWIDVKPRRRKALRQENQGQDRFQEQERVQNRDDFKLRQSRVRFAPWDDRNYGDSDTCSEYYGGRVMEWGDSDFDEEYDRGIGTDRSGPSLRLKTHRSEGRRVVATSDQNAGARGLKIDSPVKRFVSF